MMLQSSRPLRRTIFKIVLKQNDIAIFKTATTYNLQDRTCISKLNQKNYEQNGGATNPVKQKVITPVLLKSLGAEL